METPPGFDWISFHDGSLVAISHDGTTIVLSTEDIETSVASQMSFRVVISGVEMITKDGVLIDALSMQTEEAEILQLHDREPGAVTLRVKWQNWELRSQQFAACRLFGSNIRMLVTQNQPEPESPKHFDG